MQLCHNMPVLICGKINKIDLLNDNLPIKLASVKVNTRNIGNPCVLINYSSNLAFSIFDFNPILSIAYRLVRKSNKTGDTSILEQWNYKVSEVIPTIIRELNTIEPLVLNFCDCLNTNCDDESFTYILQITQIITQNTTFNISKQEISAIVSSGMKMSN